MRIATWNINGLRARLDYIKLWLSERQPDVVGLQELKMQDHQFPHDEFEALGYRALTHGQKSWNGVAILSRLPIELIESGLPGQEDFGARLIRARVGEGEGQVDFTTLYCPNGKNTDHDDFHRKLAWFDALREWASRFVSQAGFQEAIASSEIQRVISPRWTRARSYSDQLFTRYLVLYIG